MKSHLPHALATIFAAGAASLAVAQALPGTNETPSAEPTATPVPAWVPSKAPVPTTLTFVQEPVASASRTEVADAEAAKWIVDALNAEPSMKGSKITVQPDSGTITLTGVVPTREQVKKAGEIAKQLAGEGTVVNVIQDAQS